MSQIDPNRPDIVAFLATASEALGEQLPAAKDVFRFGGDDPQATDKMLGKAVAGLKTGTTSWPVPSPQYWGVGDVSVILDGAGRPGAVMRTLSLVRCRFRDVTVEFAESEDEGGYEGYRQGHIEFYGRQPNGREFGDDSEVLCERFEVIYPRKDERKEESSKAC